MTRIKVGLVIPAFNEARNIGSCLEAVMGQEGVDAEVRIVVVDNGSRDGTVEIAKRIGVQVIEQRGGTIGSLRNRGAREIGSDVIGFVDGDCIPGPRWLLAAVSTLRAEGAGAVGSYHEIPEGYGWIGRTCAIIQRRRNQCDPNYIPSGNMVIMREAFEAVRGFDETLETNEDVDLCRRLVRSGYRICINPSMRCTHLGSPRGIGEMMRREIWHGGNTWKVFWEDFRSVRNLWIVAFSMANLLLIVFSLGASIYWMLGGSWLVPLCFSLGFIGLNGIVAFRDWRSVRKGYLSIFCYVVLYGIARAIGVWWWLVR